jgi:hypothetical protein
MSDGKKMAAVRAKKKNIGQLISQMNGEQYY